MMTIYNGSRRSLVLDKGVMGKEEWEIVSWLGGINVVFGWHVL